MGRRPQPPIRAVSSKPEGRLKGGSIATGRAASVDLATEPRPLTCTRPQTSLQRSRKIADLPAAMGLSKNAKLSSVGHFQSEQAFTPPTHFRTLFGFSEKFGNCRPPLIEANVKASPWDNGSKEPCPRTQRSGRGRIRTEDRLIRSPTP